MKRPTSIHVNVLKRVEFPKPEASGRTVLSLSKVRICAWCAPIVLAPLVLLLATRAMAVQSGNSFVHLPDAALIDQAGRPVSFAALKGKPVLLGFIHTSCHGICEMLTAKMVSIAKQLDPSFAGKVTMVSVTTDPREDGPVELSAYARKQGAVGTGWLFLTGRRTEVDKVLKVYNVPVGDSGAEMAHVHDLYLIGPDGREMRHYNGAEVAAASVAADIRGALARR